MINTTNNTEVNNRNIEEELIMTNVRYNTTGASFHTFCDTVQSENRIPMISVMVNGVHEPAQKVTFSNFSFIKDAIEKSRFSAFHADADNDMFVKYYNNDATFMIELTTKESTTERDLDFRTAIEHISLKDQQAELKEAIDAQHALEDQINKNVSSIISDGLALDGDKLEVKKIKEGNDPVPDIFVMDKDAISNKMSKTERDRFIAEAPTTGITTAKQFVDALVEKVIAPNAGIGKNSKIITAHMNFFNIKQFNKDGKGRDYKRVASPFLFQLVKIENFIILSDVPNKDNLAFIMANGFLASVKVGEEIVGQDENGKDIMKDIMVEKLFKYVATSASKQRQERYIFTAYSDREIIRKMLVFWSDDFAFGKEASVAKTESRVGQNLSTGRVVGGAVPYFKKAEYDMSEYKSVIEFYYVLIPDITMAMYKGMVNETPVGLPEIKDENGKVTQDATEDYAKVLGDGSGLHTPAVSRLIEAKLQIEKAVMLQHRLGKGTTFEQDKLHLGQLCKYLGIKVNLNLPVFFISESMWKFKPGIELLPLTILRTSEDFAEKASMCYETWNAINISGPNGMQTLTDLANKEFEMFNLTTLSDPGLIMHRLGVIAKIKSSTTTEDMNTTEEERDLMEDDTLATSLFRMFTANSFFARKSEYLMKQVRMLFSRKIADMARGKIMVDGSFCIMMIDPGVWTGKLTLKAGECYAAGRTGKCLAARYPMVYPGEPQIFTAVDCPEFEIFKGQNVIIMNALDNAWERMQGADFDGDACLVTFEESVIALCVSQNVPQTADMPKLSGTKAKVNWDSIAAYFVENFNLMHPKDTTYVPTIGKVNNIVASLLAKAHANGTFLSDDTLERVRTLALCINDLIDAAKTGVMPELAPNFFDTYKMVPNFLAKSIKNDDGTFTNTWEVETIDQNPDSMYELDTKSPMGKLCNDIVPELFKKFVLAGDKIFNVDSFLGMFNPAYSVEVTGQVIGIRSIYNQTAKYIFENKEELDEKSVTEKYLALCVEMKGKLDKVAATFNNDIYTVAIACLIAGGSKGFAFKCYESGVVGLFEQMEGVTLRKAKGMKVVPEGSVEVKYDGVSYYAQKRLVKNVQYDKFVAADMDQELTLRLVGIQYTDYKTMDTLVAKIAASGNIISGGKDTAGYNVAMANGSSIGKVTLEGVFSTNASFVMGGTAEVLAVNFVRNKAEQSMSMADFMATKTTDSIIKSAELTIRYIKSDDVVAPTADQECSQGLVEGSSFDGLPSMTPGQDAPAQIKAPVSEIEFELEDALMYGSVLADIMGLEPSPEVVAPVADENAEPDYNLMSMMDSYCFE